ncbi:MULTISPECIES: hypothetical protein [Moraxella]|uniref:Uncharacterized protein n=1 Tax=Moraxella lacunata TaxID=477 RepID=A0A1B8PVG4_MORLA|nr:MULTISPECIES: hypothetical protein [Moraxella]MBE9578300.1 hypothetical protein [Moraxella sp. K1664]MBE9589226.1 hypothetical protein [Moraxella sp. K1630]MBE9589386.1 hypothetical protein [Moraxella sp. K127]MBE9597495.1 hypothetical protein [Moraxella sp. K2450]MDH9219875.1 hypothetical protein [Moraxella lacunata]
MTFIIAIQAKDSIVVVSDTSSFYITDDGRIKPHSHKRLPKHLIKTQFIRNRKIKVDTKPTNSQFRYFGLY